MCVQVFQCLLIDGENAGEEALREAERFVISDQQFQEFLDKHSSVCCLVPESNEKVSGAHMVAQINCGTLTFETEKMLHRLKTTGLSLDVENQNISTVGSRYGNRLWREILTDTLTVYFTIITFCFAILTVHFGTFIGHCLF